MQQQTFYFIRTNNGRLQPISEDEYELALDYEEYYSQVDDAEEEW